MLEVVRRPSIQLLSRGTPTAAKPHRCMICDCEIPAGTRHNRWVYRNYDDRKRSLHTNRFHIVCPSNSNSNPY